MIDIDGSDPGPSWVVGPGSRARFYDVNSEVQVRVGVKNYGYAPTVGDVVATAQLLDDDGILIKEQQQTITLLMPLEETTLDSRRRRAGRRSGELSRRHNGVCGIIPAR